MPDNPTYVTCHCQHCDGHIEFNGDHAGETVTCPHCKLETVLFLPPAVTDLPNAIPPPIIQSSKHRKIPKAVLFVGAFLLLFVAGTALVLFQFAGKSAAPSEPVVGQKEDSGAWSKSLVAQRGDLQIQVQLNSGLHLYPYNPSKEATYKDGYFAISLSNLSVSKKIDFTTWRGQDFSTGTNYATLTDNFGNEYKRGSMNFDAPAQFGIYFPGNYLRNNEVSIYPRQVIVDLLSFERPVSTAKWLHLELPAENFGGEGMIRFEIPVAEEQTNKSLFPVAFGQGDIKGEITEIVHGFTTGESTKERGLIVKTSNFLLIKVMLWNTSSNRIYDYTTLRNNAVLTDDKGNSYPKIDSTKTVNEFGKVSVGWVAPYPLSGKFYGNSSRIRPSNGREDMLGFDIPDSPGSVLRLEMSAEDFGGTGKMHFEIPVSAVENW